METQKNLELPTDIPCFLCGDIQKLSNTKNGKPYFICDFCGVQAFIRKTAGISRLSELLNNPKFKRINLEGEFIQNSHLFRIKARIDLIIERLNQLDLILFSNRDIELEKSLKSKLKHLEAQLNNYLKK